jgi:hypothetical protein
MNSGIGLKVKFRSCVALYNTALLSSSDLELYPVFILVSFGYLWVSFFFKRYYFVGYLAFQIVDVLWYKKQVGPTEAKILHHSSSIIKINQEQHQEMISLLYGKWCKAGPPKKPKKYWPIKPTKGPSYTIPNLKSTEPINEDTQTSAWANF